MASVGLQDAIDATVAATGKNHRENKDAARHLADAAERLAEVARRVPAAADLADPAIGLAGGV